MLKDFERGDLKPFYTPKKEFDLADAPMPRFDLLAPQKYNRLTVQTSRGCPHHCEFCASSILLTPRYKVKPVEKVVAEIREIKQIWPKPFIEFADDNSFVHHEHYKRLLRELAKEKVRWFTEADVSVAEDDELLGLMRDSGCQQVLIGFESPPVLRSNTAEGGRRANLNGIELKNNWKARQQDRYKTAIARIQSYGVTVNGCFILGLDGDTPETFDDVLDFVRDAGLYEVQVTFQTAFPGTPLYSRLKKEGRILRDNAWELCTLFRHQLSAEAHERCRIAKRFLETGETTLLRRRNTRPPCEIQAQVENVAGLWPACGQAGTKARGVKTPDAFRSRRYRPRPKTKRKANSVSGVILRRKRRRSASSNRVYIRRNFSRFRFNLAGAVGSSGGGNGRITQ